MGATLLGAVAPDLTLPGTRLLGGRAERLEFRLAEHRGTPVVLAFSDAEPSAFDGWDGLAADVWAFAAQDAVAAGYGDAPNSVYIIDPAGLVRWAHSGPALPSAADVRGQLLLLLPGPMGGTFQLPPPPS
jgi:hypothetical protein